MLVVSIVLKRHAQMNTTSNGWLQGGIGVLIFSGSLPATRLAVVDLEPVLLTLLRTVLAGSVAGAILLWTRQPVPTRQQWASLLVVLCGVVVGFPLLTALALQHVSAGHALVFMGLLPVLTALFGVWRGAERPSSRFWLFSCLGSACVVGFALMQAGMGSGLGDALMLVAIVVCGLGYAEGARLARTMGGWQVICWALVLALPVSLPTALWWQPVNLGHVSWQAWAGLGYVSLFSMLIGFFFWYAGLARGGIALVGQLQLLQPFAGFFLAGLLLGENITPTMMATALAVLLCVAGARSNPQPNGKSKKLDIVNAIETKRAT